MPRPSLVTSSGPSPVRGFIAAILLPFPALRPHRTAQPPDLVRRTVPGGAPASHIHLDQSLYYPVFGGPMVTISVPARSRAIPVEIRTLGESRPQPPRRGILPGFRRGIRPRGRLTGEPGSGMIR